jgi:transcriptional regulator with XRE-family HTH domain
MPDSRVAALLRRRAGVDTPRLSIRAAAARCNVSPQTMSKIMRGEITRLRDSTVDKIVRGLGIDRDLLEGAILVDAGLVQSATGSTLYETLERIQGLSPRDRATVLVELAQMQQADAVEQEMRAND